MKAVLLALALSSSMAFAKTCFLVDGVSSDGKTYPYLDQSEGVDIDATSTTLKSKLFQVDLQFDKETHQLTYSFNSLLPTAFYDSVKLTIENANSLDAANGITTDAIALGNISLQAHLYCEPR
jgi:hypothetical protein